MNDTRKQETGQAGTDAKAQPQQQTGRKLRLLDADLSCRKLKVVFTESSGRAGERCLLDRGLARLYEGQGKVRIINENNKEQEKED